MVVRPPGEEADFGGTQGINRGEIVVYRAYTEAVFSRLLVGMIKNGFAPGF